MLEYGDYNGEYAIECFYRCEGHWQNYGGCFNLLVMQSGVQRGSKRYQLEYFHDEIFQQQLGF